MADHRADLSTRARRAVEDALGVALVPLLDSEEITVTAGMTEDAADAVIRLVLADGPVCPCVTDDNYVHPADRDNGTAEQETLQVIDDRDQAEGWADRLAYAIAPVEVIGEHSSSNHPWQRALDLIADRDTETADKLDALVQRLRPSGLRAPTAKTVLDEVAEFAASLRGER